MRRTAPRKDEVYPGVPKGYQLVWESKDYSPGSYLREKKNKLREQGYKTKVVKSVNTDNYLLWRK